MPQTAWSTERYLQFVPSVFDRLRREFGPHLHLLHDVHHRLTPVEAGRLGKAIELEPDFANFYPAVPYPGTALYEKCVREGLLRPEDADWSKMEYSYYLLRGNGLDERVVMESINRAKRRFFLRPTYVARHAGDIARLVTTKWRVVG